MDNDVTEWHAHEALHTHSVLYDSWSQQVLDSTWVQSDPSLIEEAEKVSEVLYNFYQFLAIRRFDDFEDEE